jgi:TIR domain
MDPIEPGASSARPDPDAEATGAGSKIFISYASQDAAVAERLCAALEASGLPCWIAPRDVREGTPQFQSLLRKMKLVK